LTLIVDRPERAGSENRPLATVARTCLTLARLPCPVRFATPTVRVRVPAQVAAPHVAATLPVCFLASLTTCERGNTNVDDAR